jgi:hypothetical protein
MEAEAAHAAAVQMVFVLFGGGVEAEVRILVALIFSTTTAPSLRNSARSAAPAPRMRDH